LAETLAPTGGIVTDPYVRGYRRACQHLLAAGLLPAPCVPEMQAMWATSREDRAIVRTIAEHWELTS
jgi:hypothetical protein